MCKVHLRVPDGWIFNTEKRAMGETKCSLFGVLHQKNNRQWYMLLEDQAMAVYVIFRHMEHDRSHPGFPYFSEPSAGPRRWVLSFHPLCEQRD